MLYAALTPSQREQVAWCFRDDLFNKSPEWFDYEINREGQALRRTRLPEFQQVVSRKKPRSLPVKLYEVRYAGPLTDELQLRRQLAMQLLARYLIQIICSQEGQPA
jgi:hypothetical protein